MRAYARYVENDPRPVCSSNGCGKMAKQRVEYANIQPGDLCCDTHSLWRKRAVPSARVEPWGR